MPGQDADDRLQRRILIIKQLLELFRWERYIYLTITVLSLVLMIVSAIVILLTGEAKLPEIVGLFFSSGGITYTIGRLLQMWNDALKLVMMLEEKVMMLEEK